MVEDGNPKAGGTDKDKKALVPSSSGSLVRRGLDEISSLSTRPSVIWIPEEAPSLEEALLRAVPGQILDLAPGTYGTPVSHGPYGSTHHHAWSIDKPLTIRGRGPGVTLRVEANVCFDVRLADATAVIEGMTIKGTEDAQSGIVLKGGTLCVRGCHFDGLRWAIYSEEEGDPGGGILAHGGTVIVDDCTFMGCWPAIEVEGEARLTLRRSSVGRIVLQGGHAETSENLIQGEVEFWEGWGPTLRSEFDTYIRGSNAFCFIGTPQEGRGRHTFRHATIQCGVLLSVNERQPGGVPMFEFTDSIIECGAGGAPGGYPVVQSGFIPSGMLALIGNNLLVGPWLDPRPDPGFGQLEGRQLPLMVGSPALGVASDGTNLGAWQGEPQPRDASNRVHRGGPPSTGARV